MQPQRSSGCWFGCQGTVEEEGCNYQQPIRGECVRGRGGGEGGWGGNIM